MLLLLLLLVVVMLLLLLLLFDVAAAVCCCCFLLLGFVVVGAVICTSVVDIVVVNAAVAGALIRRPCQRVSSPPSPQPSRPCQSYFVRLACGHCVRSNFPLRTLSARLDTRAHTDGGRRQRLRYPGLGPRH